VLVRPGQQNAPGARVDAPPGVVCHRSAFGRLPAAAALGCARCVRPGLPADPLELGPRVVKVTLGPLGSLALLAPAFPEHLDLVVKQLAEFFSLTRGVGTDSLEFGVSAGAHLPDLAVGVFPGSRGLSAAPTAASASASARRIALSALACISSMRAWVSWRIRSSSAACAAVASARRS